MSLPSIAINRPVTTTMLMLAMALIGTGAMFILNIALFPQIEIPVAFIQAPYTGVDPAEMENIVTRKIEEQISTVENIDRIESYSAEGFSQTVIHFNFGTDIDLASVDLRAAVDLAKRELPRDMEQVTVSKVDINASPILNISAGGDYNLIELRQLADREISPAFQRISGVANVEIKGGLEREIRIKVFPDKMLALNLSINDLVDAVVADNQNTPLGNIEEGSFRYLIRSEGQVTSTQQLGDIIVKEINERPIYLSEIATINDSFKDITSVARINGRPSIELEIRGEANANPVLISDAARELIPEIEERFRGRLQLIIARDQSEFIRDTINMVRGNATLGGLFAICVLFIFLKNYRSTLIVGTSIPIAILATFGLLSQIEDVTLNLMTLGGLALGIGMMLDNAIVVLENTYRFFTENPDKDQKENTAAAAEEVLMPIVASTATTVAVFLPIGFVPAIVGEIFFNMSLAIVFALISSLLVAVTLIPMLCSRFLVLDSPYIESLIFRMYVSMAKWYKSNLIKSIIATLSFVSVPFIVIFLGMKNHLISNFVNQNEFISAIAGESLIAQTILISVFILLALAITPAFIALVFKAFNLITSKLFFPLVDFFVMTLLRNLYLFVLNFLIKKWYLRLIYFTLIVGLFFYSFRFQPPMEFFPSMDRGDMTIAFETSEGTSVEQTDLITAQIEAILRPIEEIEQIITNTSVGQGTVRATLVPVAERTRTTTEVFIEPRELIAQIPGIRTLNFRAPQMGAPSRGKDIQIDVLGAEFAIIEDICRQIAERIADIEGIAGLEDGITLGRPEYRVVFDREKIRDLDLSLSRIANMVRSHIFGSLAGKYRESNEEFDIRIEVSDEEIATIESLKDLTISLGNEKFVKLSQIAAIRPARGYSTIERKNQSRRLTVQADAVGRPIGAITADISQKISDIELPAGYEIEFAGQQRDMVQAFVYLGVALIASILLVYMIMASQFESLVYPLIIMFTIPLSYMGVIIGLNFTGFAFSVTAMIGIIMLAGISVNNGIILIEYILQRRTLMNEDTDLAIVTAGKLRFRPIMMTVFTTLLGMSPLTLGLGAGADFYQPLAIAVSGGLLVSTVMTLTFVPTVFLIVENAFALLKRIGGFLVGQNITSDANNANNSNLV